MNRPDSRLLCSGSVLDFVPAGFPLWDVDTDTPCVAGELMVPSEFPDWSDLLDFSAPPLRNGLPVRFDALLCGLRVLAQHYGWTGRPDALWHSPGWWIGFAADEGPESIGITIDPWPDLTNLTPDDAERAILVAALVARKRA